MNFLASGFQNFINAIFENWAMILFVLLAVLLILAILFRRFKVAGIILFCIAIAIGVALIIYLITQAVHWNVAQAVEFAVKWVPTILFAITIVISTFIGTLRGLRKSLIMLAHSAGAAAICITLYFVLINIPVVDKFVLDLVNFFMGGAGSLENALGVHAQCYGIKEVFVAWLPTVLSGDLAIMLGGSTAYIYTLADMLYHLAFFIILYVVYLLLDFIMYIIYHCCYSERKYKRKIAERYANNQVDRRYSKHNLGGSVVGVCRGLVAGILSLSLLGTVLFSFAGLGQGKFAQTQLENEQADEYFSIYRSVESYGNYGVFKVLNSIASPDDVPYYLFAADLVFSGELKDEEFDIDEHIVFREELAAYTCFARDTAALLLKYGEEDLKPVINGLVNGNPDENATQKILQVMSNAQFKDEFNALIEDFDAKTYVINFAFSFLNTAIANIDDMSFGAGISDANKDLFKMLFTKGYLCDANPDERLLKENLGENITLDLPYLNIAKFVSKQDAQILFNVAIDVLTGSAANANDTMNLIAEILPKIKKLSLLSEERAEEVNPVLGRLYCYAANTFLTEADSEGVTYAAVYREKIDWTGEIRSLIDGSDAVFALYDYAYEQDAQPLKILNNLFDKNNAHYQDICESYDLLCDNLSDSHILGQVLSTSKMYKTIYGAVSGVMPETYLPQNIQYDSKFDADGNVISTGEVYNLLNGLRVMGRNTQAVSLLQNFDKDRDLVTLLDTLSSAMLVKDDKNNTLCDYIVNSTLLRSVITASVSDVLYFPKISLERDEDGNVVNFIKKEELAVLLNNFDEILLVAKPVLEEENPDYKDIIADFVNSETFDTLLNDSAIFEGTVAKYLVQAVGGNELVVIPKALSGEDLDAWVSVAGRRGELKNMLAAVDAVGLELTEILNGVTDEDAIIKNVLALTEENLNVTLKSSVLHYTLSKFITGDGVDFGAFKLIVPTAAQTQLSDDVIEGVVKKEEVANILQVVRDFDLSDETDISSMFVQLVKNKDVLKESYILTASISYSIVNNAEVADMLKIPAEFEENATLEKLKTLNSANPWKAEIPELVNALDEILGISASENFTFNDEQLTQSLSKLLNGLNDDSTVAPGVTTRLGVCYKSDIIKNNLTARLDELLQDRVDSNLLNSAKEEGYYKKNELSSLSSALNVFEIDMTDFDADKLTDSIKDKVLTLNDRVSEGFERTKLDVIYPSVIFTGLFSEELDKALLENTDENGEPAPMIDGQTLSQIKGGSRYSKEEFKNLINSVKAFGINSFDEIDQLDFDTIRDKVDKIDEICLSVVIRGVMTYQIAESDGIDVNHPLAYEAHLNVLRTQEIKSLVTLINNLPEDTNIADMYFEEITLGTIRTNTFDENGEVLSYLLLKSVSTSMKNSSQLIVSDKLIDSYGCINSKEVYKLINAITLIQGSDDVDILNFTELNYPSLTAAEREQALQSEILCAKLTEQIITTNKTAEGTPKVSNFISAENLIKFTDCRTKLTKYTISQKELNALFNALDVFGGNTYQLPSINYDTVKEKYDGNPQNIDVLFASDLIRYKVSDSVLQRFAALEDRAEEETPYDISAEPIAKFTKLVLSLQEVKQALQTLGA